MKVHYIKFSLAKILKFRMNLMYVIRNVTYVGFVLLYLQNGGDGADERNDNYTCYGVGP
jgi:hypothetical protein